MQRLRGLLWISAGVCLSALFGALLPHHSHIASTSKAESRATALHKAKQTEAYGHLPLSFETNQGQTGKQVLFLSHGNNYSLFLTADEAVFALHTSGIGVRGSGFVKYQQQSSTNPESRIPNPDALLRLKLLGANAHPQVAGTAKLPGSVNYFIGNDPAKWRTHVPTYSRVEYKNVYPGIDMVYYGNQQQLEYDWVVAPGADVHQIQLAVKGAIGADLTREGDLRLHTAQGDLVQHAPVVYQERNGVRQSISAHLALENSKLDPQGTQSVRIGFQVAAYDHKRPLVIDPVLVYSTYLGGSNMAQPNGIAVDGSGNAYITGSTASTDFPLHTPYQALNHAGTGSNTFVSMINASGTALVYSTYLGGSDNDIAYGIALDPSNNAYITGMTSSSDFPTKNALQSTNHSSASNAFVTEINAGGSALVYSTYLGGSSSVGDYANGIAVDGSGNAYVIGDACSTDFPTQNPIQSANKAASGKSNAFVTKIAANGSALTYSTYVGGSSDDTGNAITVDPLGDAYITGKTYSTDFPTVRPIQATNKAPGESGGNAYIAMINDTGSALFYSTYLGGSGSDSGNGIALDDFGDAYVTGDTTSTDFPTLTPYQSANHAADHGKNAFVTAINYVGTTLLYSTYLGGSGSDTGNGIVVDSSGDAYVTGVTTSTDFPTLNPLQSANLAAGVSGTNAFVTEIASTGSTLVFSSYLGGSTGATGTAIALDSFNNAYVTGGTNDQDFPVQNPLQPTNGNSSAGNGFLARIGNYNWQVVDLTTGSDNQTRLLWTSTTGVAGFWNINNSGQASGLNSTGPFSGYTVQATAAGSDSLTRLLWNKTDGATALWLLNADNSFNNGFRFGPYAGWTAVDVAVGADSQARLLWTKADGTVGVWSINNQGGSANLTNYGPYSGWTATRIAAGSDGMTRLLWTKTDGTLALWLLNANNSYNTGFTFSSATGWNAIDLAVGSDNNTRLLETKSDGTASVRIINTQGTVSNITNMGPFPGWTAARIATGADGLTRLLWFKGDGTHAVWLLNTSNSYNTGYTVGPY